MNSFGKLLAASLKEFSRDRTSLSFTIILPLLLVGFFGFAYGGSGSRFSVGVVRGSQLRGSTAILRTIRADRNLKTEFGSRRVELARLHNGSIDAVMAPSATPTGRMSVTMYYGRGNGITNLAAQGLIARFETSGRHGSSSSAVVSSVRVHAASTGRLNFVIPGILATAIMWLGVFAAIPLVQQREQQVLRRVAASPVPRSTLVLAQVLSRLVVSIAQAAFILVAAGIFFGVPLGTRLNSVAEAIGVVVGLVLLGALAFVAIGYAVASLSSTQSNAHAVAQLLTMPMLLLAGVFFPVSAMPGFLHPVVALLPLTYLADALRQTTVAGQYFAPLSVDLAVLCAWVLIPIALAVRYFRWT